MIYEVVDNLASIRQGDIFRRVPRVDFSLSELVLIDEGESPRSVSWREVSEEDPDGAVAAVLSLKAVDAIVITQDCDAVRGEYISLCQINDYLTVTGQNNSAPKSPKAWQSLITKVARTMPRCFYLAADKDVGFEQPMAVDFRLIIRLPRVDLEAARADMRVARLNELAAEHFRESLGHFFRRYAYNEWYPLTKEQFQAYADARDEPVEPYPYQK